MGSQIIRFDNEGEKQHFVKRCEDEAAFGSSCTLRDLGEIR